MPEKPNFESIKTPEQEAEHRFQESADRLREMRERGTSDEERIGEIRSWCIEEEKHVPSSPGESLRAGLRRIKLKQAAGFLEEAWTDMEGEYGEDGVTTSFERDLAAGVLGDKAVDEYYEVLNTLNDQLLAERDKSK